MVKIMPEDSKDADKGKESSDERIARLEKRISELEEGNRGKREAFGKEEKDIRVEGLVESVVGGFIPGLGGIIKSLEDASPEFRQRIANTDAEIKHRIDVGWSSKPVVDYHVSTRPIRTRPGKAAPRAESVLMPKASPREPIVDMLEGKDGITVIAELPGVSEEEMQITLVEDHLEISAGQFSKKVDLPHKVSNVQEKSYKNGILQVRLN